MNIRLSIVSVYMSIDFQVLSTVHTFAIVSLERLGDESVIKRATQMSCSLTYLLNT